MCVLAELRMYVHPLFFMQDPILFSGTVRYNLDPLKHRRDVELWNALEKVRLGSVNHGPFYIHTFSPKNSLSVAVFDLYIQP